MPSLNLDYKMNNDQVDLLFEKLKAVMNELETEVKSNWPLQVKYEDILKYYEFNGTQEENN